MPAQSHGHTSGQRSREYKIWCGIKSRCYNKRCRGYRHYGGKGVTMHQAWKDDFAAFLAEVGSCPSPLHSLDRFPNRRGNYEPGNVRWATDVEQNRNSDHNTLVTLDGRTLCISEWAAEKGINYKTLLSRHYKLGWSWEEALSTPTRPLQRKAKATQAG